MEPSLLDGDELVVAAAPPSDLRPGDILLYRSPDHAKPVAHRLARIAIEDGRCVMRPDADPRREESIDAGAVLGRVEQVRRGDRVFDPRASTGSRLVLWEASLLPFARRLQPALALLQRTGLYRALGRRLAAPRVRELEDGEGGLRFVATIAGRYAAGLNVERREIDGRPRARLGSLEVRARYRGLGLEERLIETAERRCFRDGLGPLLSADQNWK